MFDKKNMDFDDEGVLRETQPKKVDVQAKGLARCFCTWDQQELISLCDSHMKYYEHLQDTEILTKDLYKVKCGFSKIWIVADSMNEAVEIAEEYYEERESNDYAVKKIRLSGKDAILRGIPSED